MTTHEAFVLGWIWGTLEAAMEDYDPSGKKYTDAARYPMAGMGLIISEAIRRGVISDSLNSELARAMDEIDASVAEEPYAIAPVPIQGAWQLGCARARSGKSWDWFDIRVARERTGLTQAELAERIGTMQSNVARWESGAVTPRAETLRKIREALEQQGPEQEGMSEQQK